jgi:hypothetical protein
MSSVAQHYSHILSEATLAVLSTVRELDEEILEPQIKTRKTHRKTLGGIVLGIVAGDIHDIGKNIVGAMWLQPDSRFSTSARIYRPNNSSPKQGKWMRIWLAPLLYSQHRCQCRRRL